MSLPFLHVRKESIVDSQGKNVVLRGTNFGGWLMMEAYFMHSPNTAEQLMKKEFAQKNGAAALTELEDSFRSSFITEQDMKTLADWGFNCVRLPFNHRILPQHVHYLDQAVAWGTKYGVYVMLDLHGAPGAQNHDWHSDSLGQAELWTNAAFRRDACQVLEFIADRYKDEPAVAGYDLLNEAVVSDPSQLNAFYREAIQAIRGVDRKHILFIEGNRWAQDIAILDEFDDDNWVYSIHFYEPLEFTFNFVPLLSYPLQSAQGVWDKDVMRRRMENYHLFARERQRPVHVGEFGVNARNGIFGEDVYVRDIVKIFKEFGFHWNYWTYKAVKHYMFPDGIYSYYPNPAWVNRAGPVSGWNTWKDQWPSHKQDMIASWRTDAFTLNTKILDALQ